MGRGLAQTLIGDLKVEDAPKGRVRLEDGKDVERVKTGAGTLSLVFLRTLKKGRFEIEGSPATLPDQAVTIRGPHTLFRNMKPRPHVSGGGNRSFSIGFDAPHPVLRSPHPAGAPAPPPPIYTLTPVASPTEAELFYTEE
jgi:hypothetical protein